MYSCFDARELRSHASSGEQSSTSRRFDVLQRASFSLACLLLGFAACACASELRCEPEVCNGRDDDCDGRVDEEFKDRAGLYASVTDCGGCGVSCAREFPSAARVACVVEDGAPRCRIESCGSGQVLVDAACITEPPVLCLPCTRDDECESRSRGARCLSEPTGGGRCGRVCGAARDCPEGYRCTEVSGGGSQCRPNAGSCLCDEAMVGATFACELAAGETERCVGEQACTGQGLGACEPLLEESCNGYDDDCDGAVDEDFVDEQGRYTSREHCGACGRACVEQGPHTSAVCRVRDASVSCEHSCEPGYVDVDGLRTTGCECKLEGGLVPVIGGDADCDGELDPIPELIFVSTSGDDGEDGEHPERPVRTIQRGLQLGAQTQRPVLVARGIYLGPLSLVAGVPLIGGYSPDFVERDIDLHPVLLEGSASEGEPVLLCRDIDLPTYVDGITVVAADTITPGVGSTAVWLDGCGSQVTLTNLTVVAGRGAAGLRGEDASERVSSLGFSSLFELAGDSGAPGGPGGQAGAVCSVVPGGGGGAKLCPSGEVSGGAGGDADCPLLPCANQSGVPCGNGGCTDFTQDGVCDLEAAKAVAVAHPPAQSGKGAAPGQGGKLSYASPTNRTICNFCDDNPSLPRLGGQGGGGAPGSHGTLGASCAQGGALAVDASGRLTAPAGGWGSGGSDGSGGGGGTAGAGYSVIGGTTGTCSSVSGGSGGGGGSGGCGAPGASGGSGGGASVGVLIHLPAGQNDGPVLEKVRIVTASGGSGGNGGRGALGGLGGSGGLGGVSQYWCARNGGHGGDGGRGGSGGGGAGGCGGGSYGVYVVPSGATSGSVYAQTLVAQTLIEIGGVGGSGGLGGQSPLGTAPAGSTGFVLGVAVHTP